jgi:transglutaminase-like putative cysteine protease
MDLAIDQHDIEGVVETFLTAWKNKDSVACHKLLGPQYKTRCSAAKIQTMIDNVNIMDMDWSSCGGIKPDSDPFDVSVTVLSSNGVCPTEFRFGVKFSPLDKTLCISSLVCQPALHVEQATRAFIEMWRMGNTEDILGMMVPKLRQTQNREQLLGNMAKMGKLQSVGLPGENLHSQRREHIEFDNAPYHVSVAIRSEDRANTFRLGFTNLTAKSFPAASIESLAYFDDRPKADANAEELPESQLKGFFTLLNGGAAGDGRGWVDGSAQVEGGFGNGRFIEAQWGNKDISSMSPEELEIYQENIDEYAQSPDDLLGDEVVLAVDIGNPLREIPRFKLEPTSIRRRVTDSCCLLILIAFYVCVGFVGDHAIKNGNPKRLLFGVDTLGNTCGDINEHNSKGLGIDLSQRTYLWWPDPGSDPKYTLCVDKCPTQEDINATRVDDYIVAAQDHTAPKKTYVIQRSTSPVLHRCLPDSTKSGEAQLNLGKDLVVLGDLANATPTILVAACVTSVLGLMWLVLISREAAKVVMVTVVGTGMVCAVITVGLFLTVYSGTSETSKSIMDPTASFTTFAATVVLLLFCGSFFYAYCNQRKLAKYAWPIMTEMSKAVKQIGRGFIVFPVFCFVFILLLGVGACALLVQLVSVGKIVQQCVCPEQTLINCKCTQSFEFDAGMRWCAGVLVLGTIWTMNILLELTRCTTAGTLSIWFFTDEDEHGKRKLPMFPTITMFSRVFWSHLGTIALVAFVRPLHAVQAPVMNVLDHCRRRSSGRADQGQFRRRCLGLVLLRCCCWNVMKYVDCDAAIVQVALHGHHFSQAAKTGTQLWMRNKRRVSGMQSFILLSVEFGTFVIFGAGVAVAALMSNSAGMSSPIAVLAMVFLVVFAIAKSFTLMYSMVTKAFILNFLEDGERNGTDEESYEEMCPAVAGGKIIHPAKPADHKKMFMPEKLKDLLNKFNFLLDNRAPPSSASNAWDIIKLPREQLTLVHTNTRSRLMRRSRVMQTQNREFWDANKKWRISANIPYQHETQPAGHVRVYVKEKANTSWFGLFHTGGLREIERLPQDKRMNKGPYNFEYEVENRRANHPHFSPQQQSEQKLSRISIMTETTSVRCAISLMKKEDAGVLMDDPTRVRPVTPLSDSQRIEYLDTSSEGPEFLKWIKFYDLKWDKTKRTDYQFAAQLFQTFQNHFYYYRHKDNSPSTLDELAAGDTAVCGTSNFFFVGLCRHFGIPARCIGGHWLTGNEDNTKVVKFSIGGEMLAIDFSNHCQSEFYADGLGWVHSDCTAKRQAKDYDRNARQMRQKLGKKGWDKEYNKSGQCISGFGETNGMLLLGGDGDCSVVNVSTEVMSREHESTEISVMEGKYMQDLEKAMQKYPPMPVCTPEDLQCP